MRMATDVARCSSSTEVRPWAHRSPISRSAGAMSCRYRSDGAAPDPRACSTMAHPPGTSPASRRPTRLWRRGSHCRPPRPGGPLGVATNRSTSRADTHQRPALWMALESPQPHVAVGRHVVDPDALRGGLEGEETVVAGRVGSGHGRCGVTGRAPAGPRGPEPSGPAGPARCEHAAAPRGGNTSRRSPTVGSPAGPMAGNDDGCCAIPRRG